MSPSPRADQPTDDRLALGDGAGSGEVRPWGAYVVLDDGPSGKVKRITVDPGQRLSYQLHHRRAEHWFVVAGRAVVTLDGTDHELHAGQAVDIPVGTAHRVSNPGDAPLVFVEVQQGDYFGEDDIVRLEDDYGRADQRP
jgi:mannose-6-phosphate isomerase